MKETLEEAAKFKEQNALNLDKMESKLDDVLSKETTESLTKWIDNKREANIVQTSVRGHVYIRAWEDILRNL